MMLLVSGATKTMARLAHEPRLGRLLTPNNRNSIASAFAGGGVVAADNAAFSGFDHAAFLHFAGRLRGLPVEWIAAPDIVGNSLGTLYLFLHYWHLLQDGDGMVPLAFVAQDGMEDEDCDEALGLAECLFIGGSTEWKLSRAAEDLARAAKARGLLVHMGRVNSRKRIQHALEIGCDSFDGSGWSRFPDTRIPLALRWLRDLEAQPALFSNGDQAWHDSPSQSAAASESIPSPCSSGFTSERILRSPGHD